jgi:hypothetical protein
VVVRAQDEQAGGRVDQFARKGLRDGLGERHLHRLDDLARAAPFFLRAAELAREEERA